MINSFALSRVLFAVAAIALLASCGQSTPSSTSMHGAEPTQSPTPDRVTSAYVTLIHNFWLQEQAADVASKGTNLAAKVCLGSDPPGAPTRIDLIDPHSCGDRAVALLAVHQEFLSDLAATPAPPRFAVDDQVFRTQIPRTISDLKLLIAAAKTGNRNAVLKASSVYNSDMFPAVTDALNDVDPAVSHP